MRGEKNAHAQIRLRMRTNLDFRNKARIRLPRRVDGSRMRMRIRTSYCACAPRRLRPYTHEPDKLTYSEYERDEAIMSRDQQAMSRRWQCPNLQLESVFRVHVSNQKRTIEKVEKLTALIIQVMMPMYNKTKLDCVYDTE